MGCLMCRADIAPLAAGPLAALLMAIAERLAAAEGITPGEVRIGPVDFGDEREGERATTRRPAPSTAPRRARRGSGPPGTSEAASRPDPYGPPATTRRTGRP